MSFQTEANSGENYCREREKSYPVSFCYHVPKEPLSELIDVFWYWEGHDVDRSKERILPMASCEIVINLVSPRPSHSVVVGVKSKSFIIERSSQDRLLGIHFKTGGLRPFLKFPFGELHNVDLSLDDFFGKDEADQIISMLHEA